jgi:iron complex outermembrane receptor protein
VQAERDRTFGSARVRDVQTTGSAEATLTGKDGGHAWVLGAALTYDELHTDDAPGVSYTYTVPALFVQDEFSVSPALALVGSARIDAHSDYGTFFSPRISALFRRGDDWSLRASIGTGFAAPTPLMDEVEATSLASLNPLHDLHAERAQSASLDARWAEGAWEINASVFGSRISAALEVQAIDPDRLELVNADGPRRALGGELLVGYTAGAWHLLANYTHLDVTEEAPAGGRRDVQLIPRDSAELAGILEDKKRGRVGIELSYTGRQALGDDPFRAVSEPYLQVNALAEIRWGEVSIFVNAVNLTNVRQSDYDPLLRPVPGPGGVRVTNLWAPAVGRSFNLGFRWEL